MLLWITLVPFVPNPLVHPAELFRFEGTIRSINLDTKTINATLFGDEGGVEQDATFSFDKHTRWTLSTLVAKDNVRYKITSADITPEKIGKNMVAAFHTDEKSTGSRVNWIIVREI